MPTDNPANTSARNRRENFRITDLLATSVQKVTNGIMPEARMIPVALPDSGAGITTFVHEINPSFTLMLIEANSKLDVLFDFFKRPRPLEENTMSPSLTQLILQINTKLDALLDFYHIARAREKPRVGEVNLSAGGIKLTSHETLATGDIVEIQMLLSTDQPCWVVIGGTVTRTEPVTEGISRAAIKFFATDNTIRETIATYAIRKQKEQLIRKRWQEP